MTQTRNIKITLEYDGRPFSGWQRQGPDARPTVQGLVEEALSRLCAHPVTLNGSGRTDAGVHARGQVASFLTTSPRRADEIVKGGNALLPMEISLKEAEEAGPDFHARFSAKAKIYDYDFYRGQTRSALLAGRTWPVGPHLNWARVEEALPYLLGEHDFASFQSAGSETKSSVRTIMAATLSEAGPDLMRLSLTGNGFLRHMVRSIAGTLWLVGRGKISPAQFSGIIAAADRAKAGPAAPPDGLYLRRVIY